MDCVVGHKREWIWYMIGPLLGAVALALAVVWLVLTYRARLLQAWETRHINALKRRSASPSNFQLVCIYSVNNTRKLTGVSCTT